MKNPQMRVNNRITKAQQTGLFARGISSGAHPGMLAGNDRQFVSLSMTTVWQLAWRASHSEFNMKAIIWTKYGAPDGLQLREVEKPIPKDNEVLIHIHASTVTAGDCEFRRLKFPLWLQLPLRIYVGFSRPRRVAILGQEMAGEIEAVGKDVTRFKVGDQVVAWPGFTFGGYAEYKSLPETNMIVHKPANMTYEEAATLPVGGIEAVNLIKKAGIQPREKVLIIGAGGSIGTYAVQLAKHFGAEVTAVDSTGKLDMLRSIGADQVMDYTRERLNQRSVYDVIVDIPTKASFSRSIRALKPNGRYLMGNLRVLNAIRGRWVSLTSQKKVIGWSEGSKADLLLLKDLIEAGKIKAVVDRSYPLEQTAEAHRYVETGQKKGHVVITV